MCLLSGIFPSCLKYSVAKLLYTKGEENCISNYRTVSLMVSFSNVFEKGYVQTTWTLK